VEPSCPIDFLAIANIIANTVTLLGLAWIAARQQEVKAALREEQRSH
jgi:hypothetical protein